MIEAPVEMKHRSSEGKPDVDHVYLEMENREMMLKSHRTLAERYMNHGTQNGPAQKTFSTIVFFWCFHFSRRGRHIWSRVSSPLFHLLRLNIDHASVKSRANTHDPSSRMPPINRLPSLPSILHPSRPNITLLPALLLLPRSHNMQHPHPDLLPRIRFRSSIQIH
jgi:hypothetical protein